MAFLTVSGDSYFLLLETCTLVFLASVYFSLVFFNELIVCVCVCV